MQDELTTQLKPLGLQVLGGFHLEEGEVKTLFLVVNVGNKLEPLFENPPWKDDEENPLDHWTREQMTTLAEKLNATLLLPFEGPPYHPFVTWALKTNQVFESPLGILIHPEFGLWTGFRAGFGFKEKLPLADVPQNTSPCDTCHEKPCLEACPVTAFKPEGFDANSCRGFLKSTEGKTCMTKGCAARLACPVGQSYGERQTQFHMEAFLSSTIF